MIYIATFYSHIGAIRFERSLKEAGMTARLMPVPRKVSSSCGTCVRFESDQPWQQTNGDIEQLFIQNGDSFELIFSSL